MNKVLDDFRTDLKNGMTISEGLQKYNLTFSYAFNNMHRPNKPKPKRKRKYIRNNDPEFLYIQKRKNHYYLRKQVRGKNRMFGTYNSLEDAQRMREHCIKHGWYQTRIDEYCEELGIERCKHHTSTVRYH